MQTVLDLKEKALEKKMIELSEVVEVLNTENQRLQELETTLTNVTDELTQMYSANNVLDITQIELSKNYMNKISHQILKQKSVIENVENLVHNKQLEVDKALKEKKIYEKLKEKDSEKFYKEMEFKERFEMDDITNSRYMRK